MDEIHMAVESSSSRDPQDWGRVKARSVACGVVVHIYRPQAGPQMSWAAAGTAEEG